MIKVPATEAGLPAIRQLLGEGINVNITLLFSQKVYEQVADAYLAGLEQFVAGGGDAARLASVASFFVSRIDTAVDKLHRRACGRGGADGAARQGRDRQCQARLSALSSASSPARAGRRCAPRGAAAAPAVGQHRHQEPGL